MSKYAILRMMFFGLLGFILGGSNLSYNTFGFWIILGIVVVTNLLTVLEERE